MAILSRQIGWSQDSNLIYEMIKEVNKLNELLGASNPSLPTVPKSNAGLPSRQIGWGQETILLYELLKEIKRLRYTIG